jgi:hypothetical protein
MSYQVASYWRILKTAPIIGWVSVINIVIGLVRPPLKLKSDLSEFAPHG